MEHDFLNTFSVKAVEYGIAVTFLFAFMFWWRFVNGGRAAEKMVAAAAHERLSPAALFQLPESIFFHPGHAWAAAANGNAQLAVGMDDFAHKLVGPIGALRLPKVGDLVGQGEKAIGIEAGGKRVDMLSPVDGKVVAINEKLLASPNALKDDPYGAGWLFKVEPTRREANLKQLFKADDARRWMDGAWEQLQARVNPELGALAADGGAPVDGIAPNLDPEHWDDIAKKFFLS